MVSLFPNSVRTNPGRHSVLCGLCSCASAHHDAEGSNGSPNPIFGSVSSCANGRNGDRDLHDRALPGAVHSDFLCDRIAGYAPSEGMGTGRQASRNDDCEACRHSLLCDCRCKVVYRAAASGDCGMAGFRMDEHMARSRSISAFSERRLSRNWNRSPEISWRLSAILPNTIHWTNGSTTSLI